MIGGVGALNSHDHWSLGRSSVDLGSVLSGQHESSKIWTRAEISEGWVPQWTLNGLERSSTYSEEAEWARAREVPARKASTIKIPTIMI
jgi:hypothetical protein